MNNSFFEVFHNHTTVPADYEVHSHDFFEAMFFIKGNVSFCAEETTYDLHPGDIIVTGCRERHKATVRYGRTYERYVIWFYPEFVNNVSEFLGIEASACFGSFPEKHNNRFRTDAYEFEKLISRINELPINSDNRSIEITSVHKAAAAQILAALNEIYRKNAVSSGDIVNDPKINDIVKYINDNLCDELSLEALSKKFHISKYYLTKQFAVHTGQSLHRFILLKRLDHSRILIKEGVDLYTAAFDSGFNNYSHFSKVFKEHFGVQPARYRDKYLFSEK